jgi:hypothetical protein
MKNSSSEQSKRKLSHTMKSGDQVYKAINMFDHKMFLNETQFILTRLTKIKDW